MKETTSKVTDKEVTLFDIDLDGEFLYTYSDNYKIYMFFLDLENNLFKIIPDKFFYIESVEEVAIPSQVKDIFNNLKRVIFLKVTNSRQNSELNFHGVIISETGSFKFTIDESCVLELLEEVDFNETANNDISNVDLLKNSERLVYIYKKDKLYVAGYDTVYEDHFFGVIDTELNKFTRVYSLYSDLGDIIVNSINIDTSEKRIYISGYIDNEVKTGYIESFILT